MITDILSPASASQGGKGAYVLAPYVRFLEIQDDTARLLDLDGEFYALSATGRALLRASLLQDLATAVRSVAMAYNVDAHRVQQDLHPFLATLEHKRLIYPAHALPTAGKREARWPAVMLRALLHRVTASTATGTVRAGSVLTLAYVTTRLMGLARTITIWQRAVPLLAMAAADRASVARDIDEVVRTVAAQHLLPLTCKERALCCWALLRALGLPAHLVIGIALFPLASHCWCELDALILTDEEDKCRGFTPVWRYA